MAAIQQVLFAGSGASAPAGTDALLREDGFYVLREDDGKVLLEVNTGTALLREDDFYVLREDGGRVLLEVTAVESDLLLREDGFYVLREDDFRITLEGVASPVVPSTALLDTNGLPLLDTSGNYILEV